MLSFQLIPYSLNDLPQIQITGTIKRKENQLSIHYDVTGNINDIFLPPRTQSSSRQHDLWKTTCFEFFITIKNQPQYWEFNLSPSGNWNVYAMDAYRQVNMREELAISQFPFQFQKTESSLALEVTVDLSLILPPGTPLHLGITSVIQTQDGSESNWALSHPGTQADFHLRESFMVDV